jgi:hypothetical protein
LLDWIEATVNASKASVEEGILFKYEDEKDTQSKQVIIVDNED